MAELTTDIQLPLFPAPNTSLIPKVLHAGEDWTGQPYVYVDESSIVLCTKPGQGVLADPVYGITLTGPIAFFESLENMKVGGGYWTINPTQLACIGSDAATPFPWLIKSTPRILTAASAVSDSVDVLQSYDPSVSSLV